MLRMMNLFLGEETFRTGVSNYLKKHAYDNAEQDDLWESLTEEAHKRGKLPKDMTVKNIMDTWTLQTGYPVITVTRNYETGTATIEQVTMIIQNKDPKIAPQFAHFSTFHRLDTQVTERQAKKKTQQAGGCL